MSVPAYLAPIYVIDDWDVIDGEPHIIGHWVENPYNGMPVNPETAKWAADWLRQYTNPAYHIEIPIEGMDDYVVRYEYGLRGNILTRQIVEVTPTGFNRRPKASDHM